MIDIAGHVISLQQLAQALKQVAADETKIAQGAASLVQLKVIVGAALHGDVLALADLGPALSSLGIGELVDVGAGGREMMDAVSGVAFATGRLSAVTERLMAQDAFYLPPTAGDWSAGQIVNRARTYAAWKAAGVTSFDNSTKQIRELRAARDRASRAGDVTAAAQATAAMSGVAAQAQLEANQIASTQMMQRAQAATLTAQQQQISRCAWERLAANAKAAQAAADAGQVQLVTDVAVPCSAGSGDAATSGLVASQDSPGTLTDGSATVSLASGLDQFLGQNVGSGQCVALVQAADPDVGLTRTWAQGEQVQGNTELAAGTPIATFDGSGRYANATDGSSHAAIYLGQNATGIQVEDQWLGQPTHVRTIPFNSGGTAANNGSQFYVISRAST